MSSPLPSGPFRGLVRRASAHDRRLLRRWASPRGAVAHAVLLRMSRSADHSLLWSAIAGGLVLTGHSRCRRAAVDGLVALGAASALANGPLKLAVGRPRPRPQSGAAPAIRLPRTSSFPSGHAASAFAFATAASLALPAAAPALVPLAGLVAYSRTYLGVHYPSDVVIGGALGVACGVITHRTHCALASSSRLLAPGEGRTDAPEPRPIPGLPVDAVLVTSPHSGSSRGLDRARAELDRLGVRIAAALDVMEVDRLADHLDDAQGRPRLAIAAGGDGTVGAVADQLADRRHALAVIPLGTSNDFARSLGIPVDPALAVRLLAEGKVATIDLGRVSAPGERPRHFVHAATVGLNVNFAKLATRASVREHLGRFTYLVAAASALREWPAFRCALTHDGQTRELTLTQLSVINAPIFGGALGLSIAGSSPDDRLLDVLAFERVPIRQMVLAACFLLFRVRRPLAGVHALHVDHLLVETDTAIDVALDGEIASRLPSRFEVAGEALRVLVPQAFDDVDDPFVADQSS